LLLFFLKIGCFHRWLTSVFKGFIGNCLNLSLAFLQKKECSITPLARILCCADFYPNIALLVCNNKTAGLQKQSKRVIDYANAIVRERRKLFPRKIV
jgi:hypothetical protein